MLGDEQYQNGYYSDFENSFDKYWGAFKFLQRPAPMVTQPAPQQSGQAGEFRQTGDGWYSYDLAAWHLIALNNVCADEHGGCSPSGSWFAGDTEWLERDLRDDHSACTLAYWHQPTFSSTAAPFTEDPEGRHLRAARRPPVDARQGLHPIRMMRAGPVWLKVGAMAGGGATGRSPRGRTLRGGVAHGRRRPAGG